MNPNQDSRPDQTQVAVPDRPLDLSEQLAAFERVRWQTVALCESLSAEDTSAQAAPFCSPAKWHLAHTTWFFETFILEQFTPDFQPVEPQFRVLFNSYYNAVGKQFPRAMRGLLTRPGLGEVLAYRDTVDDLLRKLCRTLIEEQSLEVAALIELGLSHERQHQELLLADIKHLFSLNPLAPRYLDRPLETSPEPGPLSWTRGPEGVHEIGATGDGFAFDAEGPRHPVFLAGHEIADRLITNAEYQAFIDDGGYDRSELWLDAGWRHIQEHNWQAPLYWRSTPNGTAEFTLHGEAPLDPNAPVAHISFYEADAFARWAGGRLPTEAEWEASAALHTSPSDTPGHLESGRLHPDSPRVQDGGPGQFFGEVWQWTRSAFEPYPGYRCAPGAVGEYNGKFMSGLMTLRGSCRFTPRTYARMTDRNFYAPGDRWALTGLRLARDA